MTTKNALKIAILAIATSFFANSAKAQTTILSEDFSGLELPAGWANVSNTPDPADNWYFYLPGDGESDTAPQGKTLNSPTSDNGFAIFDSDINFGGGKPENADLITPSFSTAGHQSVRLVFSHWFNNYFDSKGEVFISTDGGANYNPIPGASWVGVEVPNAKADTFDLTYLANNSANVKIKFRWTGDFAFWWALDDVKIIGSSDVSAPFISNFTTLAPICAPAIQNVSANIRDNVAVTSAQLFYNPNNTGWLSVAMTSAGNVYTAQMPSFGGTAQYYVQATDAAGNIRKTETKISNAGGASYPYFQDFAAGTAPGWTFQTNTNSGYTINNVAGGSSNALVLGGYQIPASVPNPAYQTPTTSNPNLNVWTSNPSYTTTAAFCIDLTGATNAKLVFDLFQKYDFNEYYTNFRVFINGAQVGTDFRPTTKRDTLYNDVLVDLSAYSGTVNIVFWSNCKYSQLTNIKNYNLLDNIKVNIGDLNAPIIASFTQLPSLCASQDQTVIAEISDDVAVTETKLLYSGNNGLSWLEVNMVNAGNGTFLGNIPASVGKVLYYVKSQDAAGNTIESPKRYYESSVFAGLNRSFIGDIAIPDANVRGINSTLLFCGLPETLDGTNLFIKRITIDDIAHQNGFDVSLYLISPNNDTLRLFRTGGGFGAADWTNVSFSDTAATQIPSGAGVIVEPNKFYRPSEAPGFAKFYNSSNPNGAWTLWVNDRVTGTSGALKKWTMEFGGGATDVTPPVLSGLTVLNSACTVQPRTVRIKASDAVTTTPSVNLFYSNTDGTSWQTAPMTLVSGNTYEGTIPALSGKVLYYIKASDAAVNQAQTFTRYYENAVQLNFAAGAASRTYARLLPVPDTAGYGVTAGLAVCGLPQQNWLLSSVKIDTIQHNRGRDLSIYLYNAANDSVLLYAPTSFGATFRNVTITDAATNVIGSTTVVAGQQYKPQDAAGLAKLAANQANGNGEWKIRVIDNVSGIAGTLRRFTLNFQLVSSIGDELSQNKLVVYPNPATEILHIAVNEQDNVAKNSVFLLNSLGQKVAQANENLSIDLKSLSSGIYWLQATINGQRLVQKVVKQ